MGIRETKKGRLKLAILDKTLEMIREKPFESIKVIDICQEVGISEVTFYKYFRKKEEVMMYFMRVWNYKRTVRMRKEKSEKGIAAIYSIFRDIANTDNAECIMVSLVSFITAQREKPTNVILEDYDKTAIVDGEDPIEEDEDLDWQMACRLREAVENEEIRADINIQEFVKVLSGIFYGVPIISYVSQEGDLSRAYQTALNYLFEGIKTKGKQNSENG
ncbi:MAG: TetR/AcrR family transcriptional regulator [Clostridiales bacterium]|nr:TetR/AcrR family transcriptional regulator [Clostridiales bacterium]